MANGLPPIVDPELADVLNARFQADSASLNCHQLGTIVSFDEDSQTASIKLNFQRVVYNQQIPVDQLSNQPTPTTPNVIDYPVLVQCPVFVLTGGASYITMPIAAGDTCLVCFNDRNIDSWFLTGAITVPASGRLHDLSDGLAIVGFRSLANKLAGFSTSNVVIYSGGKVRIANAATTLKIAFDQLYSALVSWTNTGGSTPNAGTIAALNAAKATADSLLD